MPTTFVDQSGSTPGTALDAAHLNGLASGLTTSNLHAAAGILAAQIAGVNPSALTGSGTVPLAALSGITTTQLSASAAIMGSQLASGAAIVAGQIASVDGSALLKGIRQVKAFHNGGELNIDSSHQAMPSTTYADWGHLTDIAITTSSGSSLLAIVLGFPWNYHSSGNWWRSAVALDGAGVQPTSGQLSVSIGPATYQAGGAGFGLWTGVGAGAHDVNILGSSGGPGGLNPAGGYKVYSAGANDSYLHVLILEFA